MQSQQKRIKWSRGETAEALEERTDTGITQASVELMENCIPDIYGNISRRPAFKALQYDSDYYVGSAGFRFLAVDATNRFIVIPFYITETDYVLIGLHDGASSVAPEYIRIKDNVCVYTYTPIIPGVLSELGHIKSYVQQNNYLLIAGTNKVVKVTLSLSNDGHSFTPTAQQWLFSAGWYAPNGTSTVEISNANVPNLSFSGNFTNYSYTDGASINTLLSKTNTNVNFNDYNTLLSAIPLGSIVQMPNIGCYFRVEGYTVGSNGQVAFPNTTFNGVLGPNDPVPGTGRYCKATIVGINPGLRLTAYNNGQAIGESSYTIYDYIGSGNVVVYNSASGTGASQCYAYNSGGFVFGGWSEVPLSNLKVVAFGSILAPVVDSSATDSIVSVERGYESVMPTPRTGSASTYPHPTQLAFSEQRLWAGSWEYKLGQAWPLVIGSQIARYNDFANNYNLENEPITLDILTKFKEKVIHLVDYNGLKIFTDSYEYAYQNGGVVKQSANGALEDCEPIVFESLCLYCDKTGNQIRAMQYEFQSNVFESSCINQVAPKDLVWFPIAMAEYEDKVNNTGKYLFVLNNTTTQNPKMAVCNFVPSNQANIWSRWSVQSNLDSGTLPRIVTILNMKNTVLFFLIANVYDSLGNSAARIIPCILDFNGIGDLYGDIDSNGMFTIGYVSGMRITLVNTELAVYSDGKYSFTATTDYMGKITLPAGVTNATAGLMINSTIRSHPIDVGGKTKSVMKRIGKTQMSVHGTDADAISINNKTGYMNPRLDHICFYGVTGMKDEIKYTITNKNGAMFHLESLLMNIEYGTLDS